MLESGESSFDVAIAGAGLAGASLALRLARRGVRVALLDAAAFPREKLCGEFLSPECWGVFERLGLEDAVHESGFEPIRTVRLTGTTGRVLEAAIPDADERPGIGLSRAVLDERLVRSAQAAGAEVFERARVSGPVVVDERVVGVEARHPERGAFAIHATVTIAADGRHSVLVRRTGTTRGRSWFRPALFGLKHHLRLTDDHPGAEPRGTVSLHSVPGGYVGSCRVGRAGETVNLCGLLPERLAKRHRGDLDALAAAEFGRNPHLARLWAGAVPDGEWKSVARVRVESSRPERPGILYAGDGQGTVDPLGGQGMTMALLGAELIEPFVTQALREGGVGPVLQRAYDRAWHRRFDRRIRLCRAFHHMLIHPWLIDLGSAIGPAGAGLLGAAFDLTREPLACRT